MYNGKIIRELLRAQKKKIKDLREHLGSTGNATVLNIINGNPHVSRLEEVADYFGVSMDVFFIRDYKPEKIENVQFYEKMIEEKDARIAVLEKYIRSLEERLEK